MTLTPEFFRWRVALASFRSQTSFINFWIMDDFFCKKKLSETVSKKYYFGGRRKCDQLGHFLTILGVILYTLAIIFGKTSPKFGEVLSNFRNGTTFLHFGHSYLIWENFCLNKFGHTGTRCPTFATKVALFEREKVHWGLHQDLPDLEEGKNKNNATIPTIHNMKDHLQRRLNIEEMNAITKNKLNIFREQFQTILANIP